MLLPNTVEMAWCMIHVCTKITTLPIKHLHKKLCGKVLLFLPLADPPSRHPVVVFATRLVREKETEKSNNSPCISKCTCTLLSLPHMIPDPLENASCSERSKVLFVMGMDPSRFRSTSWALRNIWSHTCWKIAQGDTKTSPEDIYLEEEEICLPLDGQRQLCTPPPLSLSPHPCLSVRWVRDDQQVSRKRELLLLLEDRTL